MNFLRENDKKTIKVLEKNNKIINSAILEKGEKLNKLLEKGELIKYENRNKTTRKTNREFKWD